MAPKVDVVVGDIADVGTHQAEAYVVAANNELWMGAGVAGAIKQVAGEDVEREAVAQTPIDVGGAVITGPGEMPPPTRALIHAASMGFTDRMQVYATEETVTRSTTRSLQLCDEHGLRSIVFPALGTGVGGLDVETCATAMAKALSDYFERDTGIQHVRFVVTNDERARIFREELDGIRDQIELQPNGGNP